MQNDLLVLDLAGLKVGVKPLHPGLETFAGTYAHPAAEGEIGLCDLLVTITPQMIDAEREMATEGTWRDSYLQQLALYRAIAEESPKHNVFLMHAAVLAYAGRAYAFTAASGTGKSTHLRLWKAAFGNDVQVVNGDKPLLRVDGAAAAAAPATGGNPAAPDAPAPTITAFGTPWCGKEGWQTNTSAPLAGLCILERGERDTCERITSAGALATAMRQVYMPRDPESAFLTLGFLDTLLSNVPVYRLRCTMEQSAARASFQAMTGLCFDDCLCEKDRDACN